WSRYGVHQALFARRREFGEAEVQHLDVARWQHHDVRALEVAVDDAGPASGLERLGQLTADVNDARRREPSIDGHFMERAALDVFHRQEHATAVFTKLIDRTDVRVPQA